MAFTRETKTLGAIARVGATGARWRTRLTSDADAGPDSAKGTRRAGRTCRLSTPAAYHKTWHRA
ncbi:MAG TPA: hypothetical protein VEI06_17795 [Gemmatimonadaceae bacterium]|nr:hypothetical protein [Gemmatimonadaceae bacterium]